MEKEQYYIGLDIGTDSVGWAVTNENYEIVTFNSKHLWGIRLFDQGQDASERRLFRSNRRRNDRKKHRINLLNDLFATEMDKVDKNFFQRLKENDLHLEDKTFNEKYSLFNDSNYSDIDFYKSYKTIYHLRKELIDNNQKHDIRLIYLAIHDIIKNRGHFLFPEQELKQIGDFKDIYDMLSEYIREDIGIKFECKVSDVENFGEIIKNKKTNINQKKSELLKLISYEKDDESQIKAIIGVILGGKVKLDVLFNDSDLKEAEKKDITFSGDFESNKNIYEGFLVDRFIFIEKLKAVYDWAILQDILKGSFSISEAKVKDYEKHKYDLKNLKYIIKKYKSEKYKEIFNTFVSDTNNYCLYVDMNKKNNIKQSPVDNKGKEADSLKPCYQEELCLYLKKIVDQIKVSDEDKDIFEYLKKEIENKTLLPKLTMKNNGTIPFQVHEDELKKILDNAKKHYEFFNIKDEYGTIYDKILSIFHFRIPYYVGPLNPKHENAWIIKTSNEKIQPWNFEKVVDIEKSAEEFINKMTNNCTYLACKKVIPKDSLIYSKYNVLNEINKLKINGENITVEVKKSIYNNCFLKNNKVTFKTVKKYLETTRTIGKEDTLSGIDGDFKSSLKSYRDFENIIDDVDKNINTIEEIIRRIVLFGEDKKLLKNWLSKKCGYKLNETQIKQILSLKYSGWGRFSKELLCEINGCSKETGENFNSILDAMWETNANFMQLLSPNTYTFLENIENENRETVGIERASIKKMVKNMMITPKLKRSVLQALEIVKELEKIMKKPPKKIFLECAKGNIDKQGRTISRKDKLKELYASLSKEESKLWLSKIEDKDESSFRQDNLYLYCTQLGKCMYTGKEIKLEDLFNKNIYDIDHIYPRSKVKDDSLDNRVLVLKNINSDKTDKYPLSKDIQDKMKNHWKELESKKLISKEKYERLIRTTEFEKEELAGFISRQLVETRQTTKAVAKVLENIYDDTRIVYLKAVNVSDFRQRYNFVKCRDVNDLHHAKDAYLNIVVGNVYDEKFTKSPLNFIEDHLNGKVKYSLNKMYDYDVITSKCTAWKTGEKGSIVTVKKVMKKNNILFTRYSFEVKGGFFDQNILRKGKGQVQIKKNKPIETYGGYNKATGAYFILVEHDEKKGRIKTIEPVYLYLKNKAEQDIISYCENELNLVNPKILINKIKKYTLLKLNGFLFHLTGRQNDDLLIINGVQLKLDYKYEVYIKMLSKYMERIKKINSKDKLPDFTPHEKITAEENIELYEIFIEKLKNKLYSVKLSKQIKTLESKKEEFENLSSQEQSIVLINILKLFACNAQTANLKLLSSSDRAGILTLNNKISKLENISIINQSITGVFEKEVNLLEL